MRKSDRKIVRITCSDMYLSEALKHYESKSFGEEVEPFEYIFEIFTGKYIIVIEDDKITEVKTVDLDGVDKVNEKKAAVKVNAKKESGS